MSSYRNILKLSAWDMIAKAAYFLACLYLARIMGVEHYGVWEFSISVMAYFLLIADLGMEVWATREATKGGDIPALVGKVVPLRLIGATVALGILLAILPLLPEFPQLHTVLVVFGLTLFLQAANLKWVFMGQERMATAGKGLALTQLVFAGGIVVMVRSPNDLIWAPLVKGLGDLAAVSFFGRQFLSTYGLGRINFRLSESSSMPSRRMKASVGASPSPASRATAARCSRAVSLRPRPSLARPSTSQLSLSVSDISGSENSRTRNPCSGPLICRPTRMSRFGRKAEMSSQGLSGGPLKASRPFSSSSFWP